MSFCISLKFSVTKSLRMGVGGGVKSKSPGALPVPKFSDPTVPQTQLYSYSDLPSPGLLSWTCHFSPKPVTSNITFPQNSVEHFYLMSCLKPDYLDNLALVDKENRVRWWLIARGAVHKSGGILRRTPLPGTLCCALPQDTSASDLHRYFHISPHAVYRLNFLIPSSFLSLNLEYPHCCEWPIFQLLILFI